MHIPPHGLAAEQVVAGLRAYQAHDVPWREGRVLTGVYDPGEQAAGVIKQAYMAYLSENALYPNLFPSLLQVENDIVRMLSGLLGGGERTAGNCTSGGTESILLAVKAARDKARAERPQVVQAEIVVPITAHPAFHKAAHYLGLKVVVTPFEAGTFRADVEAMRRAITANSVLLAASAPCYSHGVVDPIPQIAALAQEHGLPFHVDACVGGLHLAMMRKAGEAVPDFDLSVPGVASLSVDMHKFGYAAKNVSCILYRDRDLRRYAFFCNSQTSGYAVINPTALSSKSGGPLAGAWAALNFLGEAGYMQIVKETNEAARRMIAGVRAMGDLRVLGEPVMCLFTMASDTLNVFEIDDEMSRRGWSLQPQFSAGGGPANLHVSVNRSNAPHVEQFLADLADSVQAARAGGGVGDAAALQAEVMRLMSNPGPEAFAQLAALAGMIPGQMPESFARINTVLDALPRPLVDALLTEYLNTLYA
ncbi:MAG: aminotransferase class V-fold PLP-dependent enzyme [Chloroflexi bacterium]|nr:aminotransferase class V-fold PLP-dependent enzyme [Chloroflexota bacterium]